MNVSRGVLAGLVLALAVPVCAQSLGDLARKEQERRKATPPAAKTYTDDDLKKISAPGSTAAAPVVDPKRSDKDPAKPDAKGDAAKGEDKADKDKADKDKPVADEAAWRARMTSAREDLRKNEMFRDALQSRINGLSADFAARDDPYQRAQIGDDRQKALAELAKVTSDIEKGKKAITDIEEEARRANVPAGWIR